MVGVASLGARMAERTEWNEAGESGQAPRRRAGASRPLDARRRSRQRADAARAEDRQRMQDTGRRTSGAQGGEKLRAVGSGRVENDDTAPRSPRGAQVAGEGLDLAVGNREKDDGGTGDRILDPARAANAPRAASQSGGRSGPARHDDDRSTARSRKGARHRAGEAAGAHDGDEEARRIHALDLRASRRAAMSSGSGAVNDIGSPVTGCVKTSLAA